MNRASGRNVDNYAETQHRLHAAIEESQGGSLVELALIMPIFTLLLVGAVDFARLAYAGIEVSNGARAGVLYGAQNHTTAMDATGMKLAAVNEAADVSPVTATANSSCTCTNGTVITCSNAGTLCVSPARTLEYVQVTTSTTVNPVFTYFTLPSTVTLNGSATMRVLQ